MKLLHPAIRAEAQAAVRDHPDRLVSVFDINGIYYFVSPAHQKLLGYTPEELLGQSYTKVVLPVDLLHARLGSADAQLTGQTVTISAAVRHKSGRIVTVKGMGRLRVDPDTGEDFMLAVSVVLPG